jgi:hypothetical protein
MVSILCLASSGNLSQKSRVVKDQETIPTMPSQTLETLSELLSLAFDLRNKMEVQLSSNVIQANHAALGLASL